MLGEESLPSADSAEFFHRDSDDEEDSFDNGAATVESPAQEDIVETTTVSSVADAVAEINIASFEETLPVESSVEDLSTVVQGLRQELE